MRKIFVSLIILIFCYIITWYITGQFGKKIFSQKLTYQTPVFKSNYSKITLGGFPFIFKYNIKDLKLIYSSSDKLYEVTIENSALQTDLISTNYIYRITSPIKIQSSNNKINLSIASAEDNKLLFSTNSSFFLKYLNSKETQLNKQINFLEYQINNFNIYDAGLDKKIFFSPECSILLNKYNHILNTFVKFTCKGHTDKEISNFFGKDFDIAGNLDLKSNPTNILSSIEVNKFHYLTDEFLIKAKGKLTPNRNSDDAILTSFMLNETQPINNELCNTFILKNIFLKAMNQYADDIMYYPIDIKISSKDKKIYFGNLNINSILTLADKYRAEYERLQS